MKILLSKILCLCIIVIFLCQPSVSRGAVLNAVLKNRSDSREVTNLTFSRAGTATADAPWVMADQYIEVEYGFDEWARRPPEPVSYDWGLTIVTDNTHDISANIAGKPTDSGPDLGPDGIQNTDDDWGPGPDGLHGTADDDNGVTYGGLIDRDYVTRTPIRNQDPNFKASLCWQVYRDRATSEGTGRNTLGSDNCLKGRLRSGAYTDSFNYNSDWAYIIDKKDSLYKEGVRVSGYDTTGIFDEIFPADPGTGIPIKGNKYFLVGWGIPTSRPGGRWGVLAQHPVVSGFFDSPNSKVPNDNNPVNSRPDIVIYIGARFGGAAAGSYRSTIYLELLHF